MMAVHTVCLTAFITITMQNPLLIQLNQLQNWLYVWAASGATNL